MISLSFILPLPHIRPFIQHTHSDSDSHITHPHTPPTSSCSCCLHCPPLLCAARGRREGDHSEKQHQDGVQSSRLYGGHGSRHPRALLHPSARPEGQDQEPPSSTSRHPPAIPGASAIPAPREPRRPPQRGRAIPHLPRLPREDGRPEDLPEQSERHQGDRRRDHHLRAQGLGLLIPSVHDVRQPHGRRAQVPGAVPRAAQVLFACGVQQAEQPQPGAHVRRLAVHAQPHRQHGQHPGEIHVVKSQDQQQRLLHSPRRGVRGRQGAAAHADLQERPAAGARAGPGARACQGR